MTGLRKLLLLGLMSLGLMSCAMTTGTGGTDPEAVRPTAVCLVWQPISWSANDTDQTIREAKANNRARRAWGCPS